MLCILTGKVQTGKSRWLRELVDDLAADGVPCYGVLAPGFWVESDGPAADAHGYEKLGIRNVLLPGDREVAFAMRADLADEAEPCTQSDRAQLGWRISDAALAQVNAHFAALPALAARDGRPGLLVVDELGRLELLRGEGLGQAMALLEAGSTRAFPHALVVVRDYLADTAEERIGPLWGGAVRIAPDEAGRRQVMGLLS